MTVSPSLTSSMNYYELFYILHFVAGFIYFICFFVFFWETCKMKKHQTATEPDILSEVRTFREMTREMNPQLRVEIPDERLGTTTTTNTSVVTVSDTDDNVKLMPSSYTEIINEGLPSYGQACNYESLLPPSYSEIINC